MTVFTFMGNSVMKQDSNHSFHVVDETITAIVPTISLQKTMIAPLLRLFVDTFPNIPAHRRERLFAHLIRTLSIRYLAAMLLLLLQVCHK